MSNLVIKKIPPINIKEHFTEVKMTVTEKLEENQNIYNTKEDCTQQER